MMTNFHRITVNTAKDQELLYSLAFKQTNIVRDCDPCFVTLGSTLGLQIKTSDFSPL